MPLVSLLLAGAILPPDGLADVVRDGRIGAAPPGAVASEPDGAGGIRHLIGESDGQRAGNNLFHSFSRFDLRSDESAVYQGSAGIRNLITTITGGRSSIDGRIASEIAGANLYLINPDGLVFGENATFDLSGALTLSTADRLIFAGGSEMATQGAPPPFLSLADPAGFGFLDAPAEIRVEGSRIELAPTKSLAFVGGDITLRGGRSDGGPALVKAQGGRLDLASLAGAGQVFLEASGIRVVGSPRFGDVSMTDEIVVTTSGIDTNPLNGFFERPIDGSGSVFIRADDLLMRDAELRTLTVTSQGASDIDIDLSGALRIEAGTGDAQTGIFADSGFQSGPPPGQNANPIIPVPYQGVDFEIGLCGAEVCLVRYRASGDAGDVRIRARDVLVRDGGFIAARSQFSGDAGTIDIEYDGLMQVVGRQGTGQESRITTNANGTGNPGVIRIRSASGRLELADFGGLIIQNGQFSPANGLAGLIDIDVASISMSSNARIDSSTRGAGPGGRLDIRARDRIELRGRTDDVFFTGISTLSQPGSTGNAGEIHIETANLVLSDGAEISARPADSTSLGAAGNLRFEIGDSLFLRDATISTESPNAAGGNIDLAVGRLMSLRNSEITTSVTSGPERGGNITVQPGPEATALDASQIVARADEGRGGDILLESDVLVRDFDSAIDASGAIDGTFTFVGVEANILPEVATLATPAPDASSLLREPCAARRPGASNRFVIDDRRRSAPGSDDYLAAPLSILLSSPQADASGFGPDARIEVDPVDSASTGRLLDAAGPTSDAALRDCAS